MVSVWYRREIEKIKEEGSKETDRQEVDVK